MITGEFTYDSVRDINGVSFYLGRCISGDIKISDTLYDEKDNPIIQVIEIHQINRKVDKLPKGMTGGLIVKRLDKENNILVSGVTFTAKNI